MTITTVRRKLEERGGTHFAKEELDKGGIGMGRFTMRLGDLISVTPYGGPATASHARLRDTRQTAKSRAGIVELTPKG